MYVFIYLLSFSFLFWGGAHRGICIYIYIYTSVDLCISMHRELWIRSRVDPVVTLSVNRFVKCFVMYFDLRLVFPRVDLFRKAVEGGQ